MIFNPPVSRLKIDKKTAAARQVDAAIDAFAAGDFDVSVTLAGAAEGMLPENPEQPLFSGLLRLQEARGEMETKKFISLLNMERDWLKHETPHLLTEIEIEQYESAFMIIRAMAKLPDWTDRMRAFKVWFLAEFRHAATALTPPS